MKNIRFFYLKIFIFFFFFFLVVKFSMYLNRFVFVMIYSRLSKSTGLSDVLRDIRTSTNFADLQN